MGKKKKTRAERQAAAGKFNQQANAHAQNRGGNSAKLDQYEELAPTAAAFLINADDCCPKKAQKETGLKLPVIENIANGRFNPTADQATRVCEGAGKLGFKLQP